MAESMGDIEESQYVTGTVTGNTNTNPLFYIDT